MLQVKGVTLTVEAAPGDDFAALPPHTGSAGYIRTVKVPSAVSHVSLAETLAGAGGPPPAVGDMMGTQQQVSGPAWRGG